MGIAVHKTHKAINSKYMNQIKLIIILLLSGVTVIAQDNALFYIEKDPISISEFKYIYEKNNRDKADYSKKSIDEYLELYINFKLKVHKARELGYHQSESYQKELMGYRSQLADSYVIDKEVISRMVDEIYNRQQQDVELKHILISVGRKTSKEQEQQAYKQILKIKKELDNGMDFNRAVLQYSQDRNSATDGGNIGYVHAPLPDGFIELEDVAYTLNPGQISQPIRSDLGYHILKVESKRIARGTMEARHLLIRKKSSSGIPLAGVYPKIKKIYDNIVKGERTFEQSTVISSEDKDTKGNNGDLGFFTIGQYEQSFEDAAFGLTKDGDISEPVETSIGWHIIKRVSKRSLDSKDVIKERLKGAPNQGDRFERLRDQVVHEIKKEASFKEDKKLLNNFTNALSDDYFNYNWKVPEMADDVLLSFGSDEYRISNFIAFVKKNSKERMRAKGQISVGQSVEEIYKSYITTKAISFAEDRLEDRYPEFKNLMREYKEGILLFDIAKDMIWDKASRDTAAISKFFNSNDQNYKWKKRARITKYSIKTIEPSKVSSIVTYAKKNNAEDVLALFNKGREILIHNEETLEQGHKTLKNIAIEEGFVSKPVFNENLKVTTFIKVEEHIPARNKTLKEAKGYVISDYQDQLDKDWIEELKKEYRVKIQNKQLKRLYN